MKLRINVLTLMLGLLGGLFSCSQEELADIPDGEQACDVSLVLSIGDIQTKAATIILMPQRMNLQLKIAMWQFLK